MIYNLIPIAEHLTVLALIILTLSLYRQIQGLRTDLDKERRCRSFPLLLLEVAPREQVLYLKNDSFCAARDISIEDIPIELDYDFKIKLTLRFEKIDYLKPSSQHRLKYTLLDKGRKVDFEATDTLFAHLQQASFSIRLRYTNLENMNFEMTVHKNKNSFTIEEVKPALKTAVSPTGLPTT